MSDLEPVLNDEGEGAPEPEATGTTDSMPESKDKETTEKPWSETAYYDEKRKRQEYQRENEDLREKLAEPEKQDYWDDPEKHSAAQEDRINQKFFDQQVVFDQKLERLKHDDYDEKETEFVEMMDKDPNLRQQMLSSTNRAEFVYDTVTKRSDSKNLAEAQTRIAELTAKLEGRDTEAQAETDKRNSLTPSLANERGVSGGIAGTTSDSLEDILGR